MKISNDDLSKLIDEQVNNSISDKEVIDLQERIEQMNWDYFAHFKFNGVQKQVVASFIEDYSKQQTRNTLVAVTNLLKELGVIE